MVISSGEGCWWGGGGGDLSGVGFMVWVSCDGVEAVCFSIVAGQASEYIGLMALAMAAMLPGHSCVRSQLPESVL